MQVGGFLVVLGVELQPTGISLAHGVSVIIPDVDGCADGPVGDSHDDGHSQAGGVVDGLGHEQEAL